MNNGIIDSKKILQDENNLRESMIFFYLKVIFESQDFEVLKTSLIQGDKANDIYEFMFITKETKLQSGRSSYEAKATLIVLSMLEKAGFIASLIDGRDAIKKLVSRPYDILAEKDQVRLHIEITTRSQNRAKFRRLVNRRLKEAIKKIKLIGKLSDSSNYSYSDDELNEISMLLISEVMGMISKFRNTDTTTILNHSLNKILQKNQVETGPIDLLLRKNDQEIDLIKKELELLKEEIEKNK